MPASVARRGARRREGVKSAEGAVISARASPSSTRDNENIGSDHRRPDHRRQLERQRRPQPWRSPPAHAPRGPDRGDGRRRHRREAPPEARRRDCATIAVTGDLTAKISGIADLQGHQPRCGDRLLRHRHRPARRCSASTGVYTERQRHRRGRASATSSSSRTSPPALGGGTYKVQTPKETADANREDVGSLPERHEVRDARLRRDRLPRRHLPDHQHLLDAGRPAHPGDRPDAGHRLQPQAGQPVGAGRGAAARRRRLGRSASAPASAWPSG